MNLFVRLTIGIAVAVVALVIFGFVLKIVVFAAVLAAVGLGGLFLFNFIRALVAPRDRMPVR